MDVLHVIHQFAPESHGGSEGYLLDIAKRQRARGLDVHVLSSSKYPRKTVELDEVEEVEGIPVHRLHRDDMFNDAYGKMWHPVVEQLFGELLEKWQPKLVHVHHWVRLTCNLVEIASRHGIPAIITLHDYYTSCPRAFRRRRGDAIEDYSCKRKVSAENCHKCVHSYGHEPPRERAAGIEIFADHYRAEVSLAHAVLVSVGSTADLLAETTGVPRERYEILPLGFSKRFTALPKLPPPSPDQPMRFCYWGGIGRHKGVDVLLHAFKKLHDERPGRAELHILGEADHERLDRELHETADGLPVTFYGRFDAEVLHGTNPHVGVFPSTCIETYGLVLDECFELGRPVITSNLGALAERGEVAGIVTQAGSADSLATAMRRFVDKPQLWHNLAAKVPQSFMSRDEHLEQLLAIYERARTEPAPEPVFPPVPQLRRIMFLQLQRETALERLRGPDGPT